MKIPRLHISHFAYARPLPTTVGGVRIPTPLQNRLYSASGHIPKIARPSFWQSMLPKFVRNRGAQGAKVDSPKSKEWNPASFYIIIFILIGSQAIRMIALKNEYSTYTRSTDAKIRLLREVIEKVQRGEKVDVEKLLGTGDEAKEREWEEVLREIEEEDSLWHKKNQSLEQARPEQKQKQQVEKSRPKDTATTGNEKPLEDAPTKQKVNFY